MDQAMGQSKLSAWISRPDFIVASYDRDGRQNCHFSLCQEDRESHAMLAQGVIAPDFALGCR